MKLEDHLTAHKLSYAAGARGIREHLPKTRIDLTITGETVRRWCLPAGAADRRIPHDQDVVRAIAKWSAGVVTSNDFYGINASGCDRCAGAGGNTAAGAKGANGHRKRLARARAIDIAAAKKAARTRASMQRGRA